MSKRRIRWAGWWSSWTYIPPHFFSFMLRRSTTLIPMMPFGARRLRRSGYTQNISVVAWDTFAAGRTLFSYLFLVSVHSFSS
ncbi:hypothetical protein HBI86_152420 [Parastagonospora nodorum]|nr:hypothetical protein HBI86_152420 [Parastagonospora nodorum]